MEFALLALSFLSLIFAGYQLAIRRRRERDLKSIKNDLFDRDRKLQVILNNAPVVFSAIDSKGIFNISEGKGLEKLGRKSNQSIGISIFDMHNQNPIMVDGVRRALQGSQVSLTIVLNGIAFDVFMGPDRNQDGQVVGVSMLSIDVTEARRTEEEKAQLLVRERSLSATSKMKSEFLATMSHEIRTPINGVLGMASLLLDTDLNSQQREFTEAIRQSGSNLLTVVNDILDFSKIESGKIELESTDFNLLELILPTLKSLKFVAAQKGIELIHELDPKLRTWLQGDAGRFRQILNNVVSNAIKFTEQGKITVRVTAADATQVRVEVEDTGIGINQASLARMFVSFSQAEASMARRFGGTGLGLSIAKQLVDKMNGEIGVHSVEGQGSTFWFVLPFADGKLAGEAAGAKASAATDVFRVLVAEDNAVNQIITVAMLRKMKCSTNVVTNGLDALAALETTAYDLVLMDCQMPKMDGLEATRRFREGQSKINVGIPIIAMTANAMKGDREKCIESGMDDYISKPVTYDILAATVTKWLKQASKRSVA